MNISQLAKGSVHIELYNSNQDVVETIDTHNLVVNDANAIVANMMLDASKLVSGVQTLTKVMTASSPTLDGFYLINLIHQPMIKSSATLSNLNGNSAVIAGTNPLVSLSEVKIGSTALIIGVDVWISNAKARSIAFKEDPNSAVTVKYTEERASQYRLELFSETVSVNGVAYTRGSSVSDLNKTYTIDYEEGKIYFESAKSQVDISYRYVIPYGLNFMGLGGKPSFHTSGPLQYGNQDKYRIAMPSEFSNARQPILKPATRTTYKPELQIFEIGQINSTTKILNLHDVPVIGLIAVNAIQNNTNEPISVSFDASSKGLIQTGSSQVWIENPNAGLIRFSDAFNTSLYAAIQVEYMVNAGVTVEFIADFPKGVPGPQITATTEEYAIESGKLTYPLVNSIAKDSSDILIVSVKLRNASNQVSTISDAMYSIDPQNPVQIELNPTLQTTILDTLVVEYSYIKTTHEIYQIAMFTHQEDHADNKMFNISGIGPITKDPNTGMRVNWSITF